MGRKEREIKPKEREEEKFFPCEICGETVERRWRSQHMRKHKPKQERRVVNVNGTYQCEQCHKIYSSQSNLWNHKQSVHKGVKYVCDQCGYQAKQQAHLTRHIQSKHEGIKIQSKHEGIKYACDQCDY